MVVDVSLAKEYAAGAKLSIVGDEGRSSNAIGESPQGVHN